MTERTDAAAPLRRTTTALAGVMIAGLVGIGPVAADDGATPLPIPATGDGAALVVDDSLRPRPEAIDVDAAGEAALQQVDRFVESDWDVEALAAELGDDADSAFAFVRDRIALDPYPGVLRGAAGTLSARAGNAWDRALLLGSILRAQGHEARFASGTLDAEVIEAIRAQALAPIAVPLTDPAAADVIGVDMEALTTRARRDHAIVDGALADVALGGSGGDISAAIADHAWVQLATSDGTWLDLDPTLTETAGGVRLTDAAETFDGPPADRRQTLHLRLIAESLADGLLSETTVLETTLDAADDAATEMWLTFHPQGTAVTGILTDVLGDVTWLPVLSVGGEDIGGTPFELGGSGDVSDFFGGGGGADLTRLRLELEATAPGVEPLLAERILVDRLSPDVRSSGTIIAELLDPLPASGVPTAMSGMHQLLISNGAADLRSHAAARAVALGIGSELVNDPAAAEGLGLADLLYPLAVANRDLVVASEGAIVAGIDAVDGSRAFVGRPRAFLVSFEPSATTVDGTSLTTDLVLDDISVLAADDDPELIARTRLWYGILQTALETELALERSRAVDPATAVVSSVSLAGDGTLTLVTPDDPVATSAASGALRDTLAAGELALVVGEPRSATAFWAVDPTSGRTRSITDPGVRNSFVGGGNYVNASTGGPTWVVDPKTGNSLGTIRDGRFTPARRPPPSRCQGGTEYVILLGCVSLPASITAGMASNIVITAAVAWAIVLLELIFLT